MMRTQLQIDISTEARNHLKALAYSRGQTLREYMLIAAAKAGDAKAEKLIEKSLAMKRPKEINKQVHI